MLSLPGGMRKRLRRLLERVVVGRPGGVRHRLIRTLRIEFPWAERGPRGGDPSSFVGGSGLAAAVPEAVPAGFLLALRAPFPGPSQAVEVVLEGASLAISNVNGLFYASTGVCPHAGGPLGDGVLSGNALICPYHGWAFDVRDGSCSVDPHVRLPSFEVRVVGDELYVRR